MISTLPTRGIFSSNRNITSKVNYSLADLLAACDFKAKEPKEDKQWLASNSVGNEIL